MFAFQQTRHLLVPVRSGLSLASARRGGIASAHAGNVSWHPSDGAAETEEREPNLLAVHAAYLLTSRTVRQHGGTNLSDLVLLQQRGTELH